MNKVPQDGDIRVGFVPETLPDHALTIDVPDIETARSVYEAISAVDAVHQAHDGCDPANVFVQRYEDGSWDVVDPGEYVPAQRRPSIDTWG